MKWIYITSRDDWDEAWEIARDYLEGAKGKGATNPRVKVERRQRVFWVMRAQTDKEAEEEEG